MKRIPQKAKLEPPKPIIIKLDPKEMKGKIVLPEVKYEISVTVEEQEVFRGMVLPIPKVLVYFLNHSELLVVSMILEESSSNPDCSLTLKELAAKLKLSMPSVSAALYSLRKIGLLLEQPNGRRGAGRVRKLNYIAIQHLNDLVEGEDAGVYSRIRKATRKTSVLSLNKEDIKSSYDQYVSAPEDDPAEAEEYD